MRKIGICALALLIYLPSMLVPAETNYSISQQVPLTTKQIHDVERNSLAQRGEEFYEQKNYKEAEKWFIEAGRRNHRDSQEKLGHMYYLGLTGQKEYNMAILWFTRAYENGSVGAEAALGAMHLLGQGYPKDISLGLKMLRSASDKGHPHAPEILEIFEEQKKLCAQGEVKACEVTQQPNINN
ncbi:tetratricopeptide repeat protein [Providencia sp. PROV255]|uniref:tetratricopeptide repeat protein n=1 Tax=Providencia sp. PROV255 TaxID=2949943 RepID=UPI00234A6276|nr:tetratricopeptide repeat protein [Providencia sp. PROV255]